MTMKTLPRGVTGFWPDENGPPTPIDEMSFHSCCHTVARQLRGSLVTFEGHTESYPRNFTAATIHTEQNAVSILLNGYFPFIAVAEPIDRFSLAVTFLDEPSVTAELRRFECYQTLSLSELSACPTAELLVNLSEGELEQVRYWKPETVGELIFNFWD